VRQGFLEHPPHGLAHTLRGVVAAQPSVIDLAPGSRAWRRPPLVIVGGSDRLSLAPSRALADALPEARLVVVEGAGHVVNLADPEAFNAAVRAFLADVLH
jgi:pimeloyl-ACP methyl ester carboxylesterase